MSALRSTILCLTVLSLLTAPALAGVDLDTKIQVNKQIQLLDYRPEIVTPSGTKAESEPNDDCLTAEALAASVDAAIDPAGDEDWYYFDGVMGDCVTLATESLNGSTTDTRIYLYDEPNCEDPEAWIAFNDDGGPGLFSLVEAFELPASGRYFVRVKHFSSTGTGEYTLLFDTVACLEPPANNTCAEAEALDCNSVVSGTTDLATNDLEDLDELCVPFGADGPDVFYEVCVPDGFQLTAQINPLDWDPALWAVLDCNDETSCVAGADSGFFNDPEQIQWTNDTGAEVCLYIIPDGYYSGASGPFELSVNCDQIVANDFPTWGTLKVRY